MRFSEDGATSGNGTVLYMPGTRRVIFPHDAFRAGQKDNIVSISDFFRTKGKKTLALKATTGIGKTDLLMAAAAMTEGVERIFYAAPTKNLQEQATAIAQSYAEANPHLNITVRRLMGRNNYVCEKDTEKTAANCFSTAMRPCPYKPKTVPCIPASGEYVVTRNNSVKIKSGDLCQYFDAKFNIIERKPNKIEFVVMTTAYLITEALFATEINPADLIILDEGRHLERELVDATSLSINEYELYYIFGSDYPITCDTTSYKAVLAFLTELDGMLVARARELESDAKIADSKKEYYSTARKIDVVARLHDTIGYIKGHWSPTTIVVDSPDFFYNKQKYATLRLRFVDVSEPFGKIYSEMLTVNGSLCLMSATLQPENYIRSTFKITEPLRYMKARVDWPAKNRPVVLMKGMKLNRDVLKEKKYDIYDIVRKVGDIVTAKDMNLLIHTHSNMLRDFLVESFLNDPRVISHDLPQFHFPNTSKEAFELFKQEKGRILISASMSEGLDFKGDVCRVQIIAKIPYPNMGDVWVRRKKELDPEFIHTEALLTLEQMIGRILRDKDDYGLTLILDSSFLNITRGETTLDSQAWDNLIGYKKSEKVDATKIVEIVRMFAEGGIDSISRPIALKVSPEIAARAGKRLSDKFQDEEWF